MKTYIRALFWLLIAWGLTGLLWLFVVIAIISAGTQ